MLTIVYELILIYFVVLFIWNLFETKDFYKQIAIIIMTIPFALRILFIR